MKAHPNKVAFEGVLTRVDEVSDKPPSGARGHCVVLTRAAAKASIPSLLGMAVDYKNGWDGHDARQKVGVIDEAWVDGHELKVRGYLFARDFPEVVATVRRGGTSKDSLGMSYELADAHVADMRQSIWTLTRATFTGAAILFRMKAAYRGTSFHLVEDKAALRLAASAEVVEMRSIVDECEETEDREENASEEG